MTMTVSPPRRSEIYSTGAGRGATDVERRIVAMSRGVPRGAFVDAALVVLAAVVLGLAVGFLLTDVAPGFTVTFYTAIAFHFVLGTLRA